MSSYASPAASVEFERSWVLFEAVTGWLGEDATAGLSHDVLEQRLVLEQREVFRQLLQDHLDLRAARETRLVEVVDQDGVARRNVEHDHERGLVSVFGPVRVTRYAYRGVGVVNRYPGDAVLNLPCGLYSYGLRRLVMFEAVRGSFAQAGAAVGRATGVVIGQRQLLEITRAVAGDVDAFYRSRALSAGAGSDVLVLTADGKGVVMRPDALREQTGKAAGRGGRKLSTRLSRGEKANRKRMAEVVAVYDCVPVPRSPADVITAPGAPRGQRRDGPRSGRKWLHASVVDDTATVIGFMFDEATRRDPAGERTWVALVDGNAYQIEAIRAQAKARDRPVTIVIDFVHVLEYLWKAGWCFFAEGDPAIETWIAAQALTILQGRSSRVAATIQAKTAKAGLGLQQRKGADACVTYLLNKARYLRYHQALTQGWPIATGVIEGACRHLVKDRMDLTGARWGLDGAEAVLKLRALTSNGDLDDYFAWHLAQEKHRIHETRYLNHIIPS